MYISGSWVDPVGPINLFNGGVYTLRFTYSNSSVSFFVNNIRQSILNGTLSTTFARPNYFFRGGTAQTLNVPFYIYNFNFQVTPTAYNWSSDTSYNSTTGAYFGNYQTISSTSSTYTGAWLQIQFTEYFFLTSYSLVPNSSAYSSFPKTFYIFGSVDNTNWTLLDTQTNASVPTSTTPKSYSLIFTGRTPSNYIASRYLRLVVNSTFNGTYTSLLSWNITASYGFTPT
jgi:hypothetical protein